MPRTNTHRTLHALKLKPGRISVQNELNPTDPAKQIAYCIWFKTFTHNGASRLDDAYFRTDVWVHSDGYVNSHSYRIWSEDNPHAFTETGLRPKKIGGLVRNIM